MTMDPQALATGAEVEYWAGLLEGEVRLPRCEACGRWHWPAVWRCGDCGSWERAWYAVPPVGTVYSWTRTWHRFQGLDDLEPPFVTVLTTLDGGGHARLPGVLEGDETALAIGARVAGRVASTGWQGRVLPALRWTLEVDRG
ncbi:MAG: Zn-ribbon domain-containing OB-fold protein [Pseudomonadota bacterium]